MLISYKKKFIFIHIYKTAGTSIMEQFLPYCRLIDRMVYDYKISSKIFAVIVYLMGWFDDGMKQFTGFHIHAKAYEIREKLGIEAFDSYFTFAFVRNPFDWLVSLYYYIKQSKRHRYYNLIKEMSFKDFLEWHISNNPDRQIDFVSDPYKNKIIVDYIGHFETLEKDIITIQKRLHIKNIRQLKHSNPSLLRCHRDYKRYYDKENIKLVEDYYSIDLEIFGYDFYGIKTTN